MDRNPDLVLRYVYRFVALRKESVDRNPPVDTSSVNVSAVALRKESVDRNTNPVLNA